MIHRNSPSPGRCATTLSRRERGTAQTGVLAVLAAVVVVVALVVGSAAVFWFGLSVAPEPKGPPVRAEAVEEKADPIDPRLIRYKQIAAFTVDMEHPRALAVAADDRLYVAGDQTIHVLDAAGKKQAEIALDDEPKCLAIQPDRIYVGMKQQVYVLDAAGKRVAAWRPPAETAYFTSIAAAEHDVFVADMAGRIIWRFDTAGKLVGRIGAKDEKRHIPGFVITSPYFDVALAPDGLLRVVNPRLLRIEAYTFDGDLEASWGRSGPEIDAFCGCCNPAQLAILADGRVVTAEKGIPRIKVYSPKGQFLAVVAGPEQMAVVASDLAVDRQDRVLALDAAKHLVRVFEPKKEGR